MGLSRPAVADMEKQMALRATSSLIFSFIFSSFFAVNNKNVLNSEAKVVSFFLLPIIEGVTLVLQFVYALVSLHIYRVNP